MGGFHLTGWMYAMVRYCRLMVDLSFDAKLQEHPFYAHY